MTNRSTTTRVGPFVVAMLGDASTRAQAAAPINALARKHINSDQHDDVAELASTLAEQSSQTFEMAHFLRAPSFQNNNHY